MTDHLLSPDREISVGGKPYTLCGSFRALKAIQHAFGKDVLAVWGDLPAMRFEDCARVVALAVEAGGQTPPDVEAVEQEIVEEIGIDEARTLLVEWLLIAMSPKRDREKKARLMADVKARGRSPSPGPSGSGSGSASSAGPRRRSGRATSGS